MNKFTIVSILFAVLFGLEILPAYAVGPANLAPTKEAKAAARLDAATTNLKNRAQTEITRRVTSLNDVNTKISGLKRVSATQKTSIASGIQSEISNLNALNTKINADTDITTLRADVKSIVADYRVYLLYIPQVRIMVTADSELATQTQMTSLATKISSRLTEAQANGKNVDSLQVTLSDMQEKLTDAQTQSQNAINAVQGLMPKDYPGNKGSLTTARTDLQTARADLSVARNDAQSIIKSLKSLKSTQPVVSPTTAPAGGVSIVPTETPVVTP